MDTSQNPSKWQARFYTPHRAMPVQTHDLGDKWQRAVYAAAELARHPARASWACVIVNTRPNERERADYERGETFYRWAMASQNRREIKVVGIHADDSPFDPSIAEAAEAMDDD
jgi:hypothetical protein